MRDAGCDTVGMLITTYSAPKGVCAITHLKSSAPIALSAPLHSAGAYERGLCAESTLPR
jgi:hypothetical protein